jgi:hypothetical protein
MSIQLLDVGNTVNPGKCGSVKKPPSAAGRRIFEKCNSFQKNTARFLTEPQVMTACPAYILLVMS